MKKADIKIGGIYLTLVSGFPTRVEIVRAVEKVRFGNKNAGTYYVCKRADNGEILPKHRHPSALQPAPERA